MTLLLITPIVSLLNSLTIDTTLYIPTKNIIQLFNTDQSIIIYPFLSSSYVEYSQII